MVQLFAKFKYNIDFSSLEDWYGDKSSWSLNEIDGVSCLHHSKGYINNEIIRECLKPNTNYIIYINVVFLEQGFLNINVGSNDNYIYESGYFKFTVKSYNTVLKLNSDFNSVFYINELCIEEVGMRELDLFEDTSILLNFCLKDVKEYGKNIDTYSKQFNLPGTVNNNTFFKYIFNINEENIFDFNQYVEASIRVNEVNIKNGILKLDNIIRVGNFINYEVTFYGEIINLYSEFGDKLLEDLDYSDINHSATTQTVINSWNEFNAGLNKDNYVYPYICYGREPFKGVRGSSTDVNGVGLLVSDLYPAISLNYILDKCITSFGYTYESDIIGSGFFKSIIIPFTNSEDKIKNWYKVAEIIWNEGTNYLWVGSYNNWNTGKFLGPTSNTGSEIAPLAYNDGIPSRFQGFGNKFNIPVVNHDEFKNYGYSHTYSNYPSTPQFFNGLIPGMYRCRQSGKYRIETKFKITQNVQVKAYITKIPFDGIIWLNPSGYSDEVKWKLKSQSVETVVLLGQYTLGSHVASGEIEVDEGDMIAIKFVSNGMYGVIGNVYYTRIWEYGYGNGTYIDFKNVVPSNVKIKDFFSDILKMFNLFVKVDKENNKKLYIYSFRKFYNKGKIIDLTQKVDLSKNVKITTPKDYIANNIILKYKDDNDTWNDYYKENIDDNTYGSKNIILKNNTDKEKEEITLNVFSPTVLRNFGWNYDKNIYVYSDISNYKFNHEVGEYKNKTDVNPRLLFFNHLPCNYQTSSLTFKFEGINDVVNGVDYYPYAGHILNPFKLDDTIDLNFDTIIEKNGKKALMFDGVPGKYNHPNKYFITKGNIYNLYWRDYINNYINKNSRLIELYVKLNTYDINNIDMNDTIQIDDTHYIINKIIDYNCDDKGFLTKLELIKKIRYSNFSKIEELDINVTDLTTSQSKNINNTNKSFIINSKNIVSNEDNIVLSSNDVTILNNTKNCIIIGAKNKKVNNDNTILIGDLEIVNGIIKKDIIIDCGDISIDRVFNPWKFNEHHINDAGENGNDIFDINIWEIEDGGLI